MEEANLNSRAHFDRARVACGATLATVLLLAACGTATYTRTRTEFSPASPADSRQEKDGIVAEIKFAQRSQLPPSFTATVQACDRVGALAFDKQSGRPIEEKVPLMRPGQYWEQLAITNNTNHVLRMNSVVIRLFDPSGGQYEPMNWGDLQTELMGLRPCPSTAVAINQFRVNKVFDRNMEIVPGSTSTFWVPFRPASMSMTGVWRFAIYEVPVRVDDAGRALKTTQFDIRVVSKQIVDTYSQASPLEPAKLVSSRDVSDSGATAKPQAAVAPTAAAPSAQATAQPASSPPQDARPATSAPGTGAARQSPSQPSRDMIAKAQARLNALGFDVGTPDGSLGPRTKGAISRFQTSKGLTANGDLTPETLNALGVSAASPAAPAQPAPAAQPVKAGQL